MSLIHDAEYFVREEILRRAEKYEFPNPLAVEIFLWDFELAAQLEDICDDIVLKGGAATQLHLPLEKQRGSVDIDVSTPLKKQDITEIIEKATRSLEGLAKFRLHIPKEPNPRLPLVTYFAKMPSETDLRRGELEVKIDFLCECPDLPSLTFHDVPTFAVLVRRMRCSTAGTLIGDKLLTLAKGSIGMKVEADYPKQIYDIDALLESCSLSKSLVSDILASVSTLTELEASFRNMSIQPIDALHDVIGTMDGYSQVDTSGGDAETKKDIEGFQQFLVNRSQRKPYYEWSSKSLRIRFLSMLIGEIFQDRLSESDVVRTIIECRKIAAGLRKISGNAVRELREKILGLAQTKIRYFREMRGKSLERVFWQIITLENLEDMRSLLDLNTGTEG